MNIGALNTNNLYMRQQSKSLSFVAKEPVLKDEQPGSANDSSYKISDYDFFIAMGVPLLGALSGTFLGHIHNCSDNIIKLNRELLARMNAETKNLSKYIKESIDLLVGRINIKEASIAQKTSEARKAVSGAGNELEREAKKIQDVKLTLLGLHKKEIVELNKLESMTKLIENYKKQNLRTFAVVGMFSGIALAVALLVAKHKYHMVIQQEVSNESKSKS